MVNIDVVNFRDEFQLINYNGKGVVLQNIYDLISKDVGLLGFLRVKNMDAGKELDIRSRLRKFGVKIVKFKSRDISLVVRFIVNNNKRTKLPLFYNDFIFISQGGSFFVFFPDYDFFLYFKKVFLDFFKSGVFHFLSFKSGSQVFLGSSLNFNSITNLINFNFDKSNRIVFNFYFHGLYFRNILFLFVCFNRDKTLYSLV